MIAPPRGSAEADITRWAVEHVRGAKASEIRLADVDSLLKEQLRPTNLGSFTYFSTPSRDGFAAVASIGSVPQPTSSEIDKWTRLPETRSRTIAILVTGEKLNDGDKEEADIYKTVSSWRGYSSLPSELGARYVTNLHHVVVRFYDVTRHGNSSYLTPGEGDAFLREFLSDVQIEAS